MNAMEKLINSFKSLVETMEKLIGPDGCPWDKKQTLDTIRASILEEAHEVVDAIESKDEKDLLEEIGDHLFLSLFAAQLAKKQTNFGLNEVINAVNDKLIRRHPHVFADFKYESESDLAKQWKKSKNKKNQENIY